MPGPVNGSHNRQQEAWLALLQHAANGLLLVAEGGGVRMQGALGWESRGYVVTLAEKTIVPANAGDLPPSPIAHG